MSTHDDLPDCQACGACCASPLIDTDTLASVEPADMARMSPRTVRLHVWEWRHGSAETSTAYKYQRSGPLAGARVCVCSALSGSLMKQVKCLIYDERPRVCHEFERGGERCLSSLRDVAHAAELDGCKKTA